MNGALTAELIKLRSRTSTWVLAGLLLLFLVLFGYAFIYLAIQIPVHQQGQTPAQAARAQASQESLRLTFIDSTDHLVRTVDRQLTGLASAIVLILGALSIGSEFGWGTVKTILIQRPTRLTVLSAHFAALAIVLLVLVILAMTVGFISGTVSRALLGLGDTVVWPSALDLVQGIAAGWLILAVYAAFGVLLGVVFRGTALAIGIGLMYMLIVENVLSALFSQVAVLSEVVKFFPGRNAGDLAASVADQAQGVGPWQATLMLLLYTAAFLGVAGLIFRRRDVT